MEEVQKEVQEEEDEEEEEEEDKEEEKEEEEEEEAADLSHRLHTMRFVIGVRAMMMMMMMMMRQLILCMRTMSISILIIIVIIIIITFTILSVLVIAFTGKLTPYPPPQTANFPLEWKETSQTHKTSTIKPMFHSSGSRPPPTPCPQKVKFPIRMETDRPRDGIFSTQNEK